MPTVANLASEMTEQIPGLPRLLAAKQVNLSLDQLQQEYLWSWNTGEGILIIPNSLEAGTVAVTKFSSTIIFDAAAIAIINTAPDLTTIPITSRQFRKPGGPIYSILAYNSGTGVATLDRLYLEDTNVTLQYLVYRAYYDPPSTDGVTPNADFLRYLSITNYTSGYTVAGSRLYVTQAQLSARDPLRGAFGQPYYVATYKPSANGFMQNELWPHCTFGQGLKCSYARRHVDLAMADSLPGQCAIPLLRYKMFEHGYRWALQNSGRIPELKGVDWRFSLAEVMKAFKLELVGAKRNDKEILLNLVTPGSSSNSFSGPIDSNFMQSHDFPAVM